MASTVYSTNEVITNNAQVPQDDDFVVPNMSDSDSDSEEIIDISVLKRRMWKNQMLLTKLEAGATKPPDKESVQCSKPLHHHHYCPLQKLRPCSNLKLKALQRAEDGVLHCMLELMRGGDTRGFVYGILPKTGSAITGSSDNLRAWWQDTVAFERDAPLALLNDADADVNVNIHPDVPLPLSLSSYLHKLQDMNDNTIGFVLSALIQHCKPPQRSFPFTQGMAPPWWPTGQEAWWGLQGLPHAQLGPPPYKKPHDLRKGLKLNLLAAVIKHMSPRFSYMRELVWQSKRLQHKMSAKDVDTWCRVLNQEEALVKQTDKSLVITPMNGTGCGSHNDKDTPLDLDDGGSSDKEKDGAADHHVRVGDATAGMCKRRRMLQNSRGCWCECDLPPTDEEEHSLNDVDLEMYSVDELMELYSERISSGDFGVMSL